MTRPTIATDVETWKAIRDAAFQVVLLTRRDDGSWKLPTVDEELSETHHPAGSSEHRLREQQGFGYTSLTVCLCALIALREAAGAPPPGVSEAALEAFAPHRGPDGGYGTPNDGADLGMVDALPRHTGSAAAAYLLFSRNTTSEARALLMEPTVKWLLSKRLPRGGWPHSWSTATLEPGYLTTAGAILGLCLFLDSCQPSKALAQSVRSTVAKAYDALAAAQNQGLWEGDRIRSAHQFRYSACALRFLHVADRNGTLSAIVPQGCPGLAELTALFTSHAKDGGWPEALSDTRTGAIATISALELTLVSGNPAQLPDELLVSAEQTVLAAWRSGSLASRMRAWDWQCLLLLAARMAEPISSDRQDRIVATCNAIRRQWQRGTLKRSSLRPLDENARWALIFALTNGQGFPRRGKGVAPRIARELLHKLVVHALWVGLGGLLLLVSLLIFGTDPLDQVRAFLERLASSSR